MSEFKSISMGGSPEGQEEAEKDYTTLKALKATLSLGEGDSFANSDLEAAITAASRSVDKITGRHFWKDGKDTERSYRAERTGRVRIDDLVSLTAVAMLPPRSSVSETWELSEIEPSPLNAATDEEPYEHLDSLVARRFNGKVTVTGVFGWPAVPAQITEATTIIATKLTKRAREAPFGIAAMGMEGGAVYIARSDPDVSLLLSPFIKAMVR